MIDRHARRARRCSRPHVIAVLAAVAGLTLAACGTGTGAVGSGDDTVKITVLTDSSGKAAFFGKAIEESAKFTEQYINDKGGWTARR